MILITDRVWLNYRGLEAHCPVTETDSLRSALGRVKEVASDV